MDLSSMSNKEAVSRGIDKWKQRGREVYRPDLRFCVCRQEHNGVSMLYNGMYIGIQ